MFIGHYAPALLLHRARPTLKLWYCFVAVQLVDVFWALFLLSGVEHARVVPGFTETNPLDLWDMPYTHSLAATVAWALLSFTVWRALARRPTRTGDAAVIAIAVASHFVADWIVHAGDLPVLASQGTKLGLGLWKHRSMAFVVEVGSFAGASLVWWLPRSRQPGARAVGTWLLAMTFLAGLSFFFPTPPTPSAVALTSLTFYALFALLAGWAERKLAAEGVRGSRTAAT